MPKVKLWSVVASLLYLIQPVQNTEDTCMGFKCSHARFVLSECAGVKGEPPEQSCRCYLPFWALAVRPGKNLLFICGCKFK